MSETALETRPAWEWRAMGATWRLRHTGKVEIEVVGPLAAAIAADERRWSRFLDRSEVARLNRAPGVPLQVSTETLDLLLACDRWHEQTEGAFSVIVGAALVGFGYRESQRVRLPRTAVTAAAPIPGALVVVDAVRRLACVPDGQLTWAAWRACERRSSSRDREALGRPAILPEVATTVAVRGDHPVAVSVARKTAARAVALRDGRPQNVLSALQYRTTTASPPTT
jgi:hypothetical protein